MEKQTVVILETSDVHGNVFPLRYGDNQAADAGLAKVSTVIQQEKQSNNHVVLIDNGDLIQGTPFTYHYARFNLHQNNPMVALTNALQYDAAVIGNHEFNFGLDVLHKTVKEANHPYLAANIVHKETQTPYFGQPYIVKAYDSIRIGILGLTTPYIPNWEQPENIEGIDFLDPVEVAKEWVPYLRTEEKVDVVIVSYHGGFERDLLTGEPTETLTGENQGYQLCYDVEGIDVLLTGHQHRLIDGEKINGVTVVQPGNNGIALGKVTLELERKEDTWKIANAESVLLSTQGVEADANLLEQVYHYEKETQTWLDQPIGHISGDMVVRDPMQIRLADHPLIEFINKVQMHATGVDISNTALFDNYAPGLKEKVTMRDVVANYIYPNTLKVLEITGEEMKAALERSASYFETYNGQEVKVSPSFSTPKPQHFNYDMWEGIDYLIDIRLPIGERIVQLDYQGKPVQMGQTYRVVMNNYRAGGGGEYTMFKDKPVWKEVQIDTSELIAQYIMDRKVVKATVNHNWKVVY